MSLTPARQAMIALGAIGVASWCVYATGSVLLQSASGSTQSTELQRQKASYERWLAEAQAQAAAAQAQLDERGREYERMAVEFEQRHQVLATLLDAASGSDLTLAASRLENNGDRMVTLASLDEADPRQPRPLVAEQGVRVQTIGFRARADSLRSEQEITLARLENAVVNQSEQIRGALSRTGVSIGRLTAATEEDGQGGPLISEDLVSYLRGSGMDSRFARRVEQVAARVAEARGLNDLMTATPLGPPVGVDHRETSGYGHRLDPITGRPAFHRGLDLAAFDRAPVVATAGGTVSFAGTMSGYGNIVEVDHGHGFRTRYAHLRDYQVRRGDRVYLGQRIGSMGSTGRSTGTHLHYEVWFRGRTYDPVNFIRAGRHVHEQG